MKTNYSTQALQDYFFLMKAFLLAKIRKGFCAPNPSVGAVVVKDNKIIAEGFHFAAGYAHAEVDAFSKIPNQTQDATLYVTLEPCCHFGRTPPCTDAIIKAGIKRVVYGYKDPNPLVAGKGESTLKAANIVCDYVPMSEIDFHYQSYAHWHQTRLPFVTAKIAMTIDGKIAADDGKPLKITSEATNIATHHYRKMSDAILTTAKTILADDPQLNARFDNEIFPKKVYVLDSQLRTPLDARLFSTAEVLTFFHSANATSEKQNNLKKRGARCVCVEEENKKLNLTSILKFIGQDGVHNLWIEAGKECFSEFINQKLIQHAIIYVSPKVAGKGISFDLSMINKLPEQTHWQILGDDALCDIYFS